MEEASGGITFFRPELFSLTVPKKNRGASFWFSNFSGFGNFLHKRGLSRFSIENFWFSSPTVQRTFVGTHFGFQKNCGMEKNIEKGAGVVLRFSIGKNFCLPSLKNFVEDHSLLDKTSGIEKDIFCMTGYITISSRIFFGLTVSKIFVSEPFCLGKNLVWKKSKDRKGGHHDFPLEILCPTIPKNFVGKHFCVSENFWCGKNLWMSGLHHVFPAGIFCLIVPKNIVGAPF